MARDARQKGFGAALWSRSALLGWGTKLPSLRGSKTPPENESTVLESHLHRGARPGSHGGKAYLWFSSGKIFRDAIYTFISLCVYMCIKYKINIIYNI